MTRELLRRLRWPLAAAALLGASTPAAAHSGTTHAGTPHWLLFVFVVAGLAVAGGATRAAGRGLVDGRIGLVGVACGVAAAIFGGVGLVELQVVADVGPKLSHVYPVASVVVGTATMVGSLLVGRRYWPERPRYAGLGAVLGGWIAYPAVMPNGGITHPLGYLLAAAVPLAVGYVLWRDARGALGRLRAERTALAAGAVAAGAFCVFFAFSAGTVTMNPDDGANAPTEAVVTAMPVADPLVVWPAVEFAFPAIPLAGYVSVGTLLLAAVLGGLVGVNAALVVQQWDAGATPSSRPALLGSLATTGATACCCCAPAMYGVLSVLLGATATPAYWAFMDPSAPLGGMFFSASVLLLLGSVVRAAGARPDAACAPPTAAPA